MRISVNGETREAAATTLKELLSELGYEDQTVATALNQAFVRAADRAATPVTEGDSVEIVSPRQGG
jgi:sulfur carrier protein